MHETIKSLPASKRYTLSIHDNRWRKPWSINVACTRRDYSERELDCMLLLLVLKVLGPIPHLAGLEVE